MPSKTGAIRMAIALSVTGAVAKLVVGLASGSMAMISSAADSLGDIVISMVNLAVVRFSDQAPDDDHNYGHAKIEGLGAMFEGGFVGAAGLFVLYGGVQKLRAGGEAQPTSLAIAVMVPLVVLTWLVVRHMRHVAEVTGSLVVKADALHYATDVWMNLGVLVSLVLVRVTGRPEIDAVVSIGIALYMLWSCTHVVREGFDVVMDRSLPVDQAMAIRAILTNEPAVISFHDFRTRGGKEPHVDAHLVVSPDMTTRELHDLHLRVQDRVREVAGPLTKVLLHADPEDDSARTDTAAPTV